MGIIKARDLKYEYFKYDDNGQTQESQTAVDSVNLDIREGQFIAILGHNGSGKSTLAKHMNALLIPTEGTMWVDGKDTAAMEELWEIRQTAGMVFQNPDNQIIGTVVEEDVGFGPENMGVPTDFVTVLPISFPEDRSRELPLPGLWPCSQSALFWMSQQPCWTPTEGRKCCRQSMN